MKISKFINIVFAFVCLISAPSFAQSAAWTNGDNSHMTSKGFTCNDIECTSTTTSSGIVINSIGISRGEQAILNIYHNVTAPIAIYDINYLTINNNATIGSNVNGIYLSGSGEFNLFNSEFGIIANTRAAIFFTNSTMTSYIENYGAIGSKYSSNNASQAISINGGAIELTLKNYNLIGNTATLNPVGTGIYVSGGTHSLDISNYGSLSIVSFGASKGIALNNTTSTFNLLNGSSDNSTANVRAISMTNSTITGNIENYGVMYKHSLDSAVYAINITSSATYLNTSGGASAVTGKAELVGNIINHNTGIIEGIYVSDGSFLNGHILNEGTVTTIINESLNRIDYRGSGTVSGNLHSTGGFVFSEMNRAPMNQTNAITGSGGIIYDGTQRTTTLNLAYATGTASTAQITSAIGDLTLNSVILSLTLNSGYLSTGSYLLASSNTSLTYTGLTVLNNGMLVEIDGETAILRIANGNELWLDYFAMSAYWTQGDNSHLEGKSYTCTGNDCTSTVNASNIAIVSVGDIVANDYATLTTNNDVTGTTNAIDISGTNYLNIVNSATISGTARGISINGDSGNIAIDNSGTISGTGAMSDAVFISGNYTFNLTNTGTLTSAHNALGISSNETVNFTIINSNLIEGSTNGILIEGDAAFTGYIQNNAGATISGGTYAIQNTNLLYRVMYTGNGTLVGDLYSDGGFTFYGMTRAPINNVYGEGGVTYDGTLGAVTLNLAYTSADMTTAKIISNIGNLTLNTVSLNLTGTLTTGSYLLASSNAQVSYNNLTLLNNGSAFNLTDYTTSLRYANNNTQLWLDYILNYWTQGD
ncbi:MAG: hypothetical protein LBR35_01100, partial [Rickettsiales bacterium]|nr:hypothetical protein [Rickettsiales bacterium]